jgi:hypothetical protein
MSSPAAAPPQPKMSRMLLMLGLTFGLPKFVDLNNAGIVQILQAAYAFIGAIMYLAQMNLVDTVAKAHAASPDAAKVVIYVREADKNPLMAMFSGEAAAAPTLPKFKKTTLAAHEASLAATKSSAALMAIAQPFIFSMFFKVHIMLAIRVRLAGARGARVAARRKFEA